MRKITEEDVEHYLLSRVSYDHATGCWNWVLARDKDGYGWCTRIHGTKKAHRLSFQVFSGDLIAGLQIIHSCDNPPCINPAHLRQGTVDDNMKDAIARDRHGDRAKLTAAKARKIRTAFAAGNITQDLLAKRHKVNPSTVSNIITRDTWRYA